MSILRKVAVDQSFMYVPVFSSAHIPYMHTYIGMYVIIKNLSVLTGGY